MRWMQQQYYDVLTSSSLCSPPWEYIKLWAYYFLMGLPYTQ